VLVEDEEDSSEDAKLVEEEEEEELECVEMLFVLTTSEVVEVDSTGATDDNAGDIEVVVILKSGVKNAIGLKEDQHN